MIQEHECWIKTRVLGVKTSRFCYLLRKITIGVITSGLSILLHGVISLPGARHHVINNISFFNDRFFSKQTVQTAFCGISSGYALFSKEEEQTICLHFTLTLTNTLYNSNIMLLRIVLKSMRVRLSFRDSVS